MKRVTFVLAAWLVTGPAWAATTDLLDAYRLARSGDPVLAAADAARRSVREGVTQARAPLLPQVSAGIALNQTHDGDYGRSRSREPSATLSQVLVDVGRLAQIDAARASDDAQQAVYRAAEQTLCIRVASTYIDVLTALDTLRDTEANEAAYLQQVTQSEARFRTGLAAQVNVDRARAYHAAAQASSIGAREALEAAREALAEITGSRAESLKTLRDDLPLAPPSPTDPQAWVSAALQGNPLLTAQQLGLRAADLGVDAARAGHLPTLTAAVDVGRPASWARDGSITGGDARHVTSIGVLLRVPLFTGGNTQSLVAQALAQRDAAGDELESRRRRVARETLAAYRSVIASIGQVTVARVEMAAARQALESTRAGQDLGTQTMTDLLLAIQALTSAQGSYSQARHRFVLGQLLLKQAAGTIDEADLAATNALLN